MEIIHQAPYTEVIGIKEAKPLQNKLYNLKIDGWKNRFSHHGGEPYRTLPGDVLILADYKPEAVRDLQRIRRLWCFASTVWTTEDEGDSTSLKVKASKDIDLEERRNKTLFLIFLTNVNPNRRIWGALHMPGNLKLLRQILCSRDDVRKLILLKLFLIPKNVFLLVFFLVIVFLVLETRHTIFMNKI